MVPQIQRDVGQLVWAGFDGTSLTHETRAQVHNGQIGGAILFRHNLPMCEGVIDVDALSALNRELTDSAVTDPLLIAVDQEGGRVQRVTSPATIWPPMPTLW